MGETMLFNNKADFLYTQLSPASATVIFKLRCILESSKNFQYSDAGSAPEMLI